MVQILLGGVLGGGGVVFGGEAHNLDFLPVFPRVNRLRGLFEKSLQEEIQPVAIPSIALGTVTGLGDGEVGFWFSGFSQGAFSHFKKIIQRPLRPPGTRRSRFFLKRSVEVVKKDPETAWGCDDFSMAELDYTIVL